MTNKVTNQSLLHVAAATSKQNPMLIPGAKSFIKKHYKLYYIALSSVMYTILHSSNITGDLMAGLCYSDPEYLKTVEKCRVVVSEYESVMREYADDLHKHGGDFPPEMWDRLKPNADSVVTCLFDLCRVFTGIPDLDVQITEPHFTASVKRYSPWFGILSTTPTPFENALDLMLFWHTPFSEFDRFRPYKIIKIEADPETELIPSQKTVLLITRDYL